MSNFQLSTAVSALIRVTRPSFKCRQDRVAYAVHAYYLCQGYRLVGLTEEGVPAEDAQEISSDGWNDNPDLYVFVYQHSSKEFRPVVVKCLSMDNLMVVCASALPSDGAEPKTMNVSVDEVTNESEEVLEGYTGLDNLVKRLSGEIGEFKNSPKEAEEDRLRAEPHSRLLDQPRQPPMMGNRFDYPPTDLWRPGGGMHIGLNDPHFAPHLRHPELQPRFGGMRYDPIGPPGMQGYRPDDFQRGRGGRFHHDMAPPGSGFDHDPDHMFG